MMRSGNRIRVGERGAVRIRHRVGVHARVHFARVHAHEPHITARELGGPHARQVIDRGLACGVKAPHPAYGSTARRRWKCSRLVPAS